MGSLARHDVQALKGAYGLRHFVETGAGIVDGLAYALRFGFETMRSCEVDPALCNRAFTRFSRCPQMVLVYPLPSAVFLRRCCEAWLPRDESVLFWLDAHFPGADYAGRPFDAEPDATMRLPLADELRVINELRPLGRDVILCDDARIYVDGSFAHGNLPDNVRPACPRERGIGFVRELFEPTHDVRLRFDDEGYIVLLPKHGAWLLGEVRKDA